MVFLDALLIDSSRFGERIYRAGTDNNLGVTVGDMAEKVVWCILGFRCGSESSNIGIYRAIIASDTEVVAGERVIIVEYRRQMARLFQVETDPFHGVSS